LKWDFENVWTINKGEYPTFNLSTTDRIEKNVNRKMSNNKWIDLLGRQQDSISQPGIFITNGKKVATRNSSTLIK
jgi:hypothetical protein